MPTTQFTKTATIKAVDEEERTATAAVLVPGELDHQGDFFRVPAIERFFSDDVDTGVMHAAFPDDAATLERSEIIDEPETIGDEEFPAGTWVATRRYEDDDLWELVKDGVLTGFSIGGDITDGDELEAVPDDVVVPDAIREDVAEGPITELIDGGVTEISDVDLPAVPRATYKGRDLGKSVLEDVDGEEEFVEVMTEQRGHTEDDARRLYAYLVDVREDNETETDTDEVANAMSNTTADGDAPPDDHSEPLGDTPDDATKWRRFKAWLTGSDDGNLSPEAPDAADAADASKASGGDGEEDDDDDDEDDDEMSLGKLEKDLTPEQAEIVADAAAEFVDAHGDATVGEFRDWFWEMEWAEELDPDQIVALSSAFEDWHDEMAADAQIVTDSFADWVAEQTDGEIDLHKYAPAGDTADGPMSDDNETNKSESPAWADSLTEKVESIEKRVAEVEDHIEDGDGDAEKSLEDAPEWASSLAKKVDDLDERVESIAKQSGHSQQLGKTADEEETEESNFTLDPRKAGR